VSDGPRHAVRLDPFWIDRTPVTNAAYADFMADYFAAPRERVHVSGLRLSWIAVQYAII